MSLSSAISRNDYIGNGATSVYSFTFKIQDASHIKVIKLDTSNIETVLNLNSDYTITGVGSASGGSVTLLAGNLTSGYKLAIVRNIPLKQETDIRNQGAFYPEIHEDVFDRLTSIDQQQQDSIDRSLRLPQSLNPSSFDMELPSNVVASPDSTIVINATGTGLEVGPTIGSISSAATNASNAANSAIDAANSASAAAASASLAASNAAAGLWKDVVFLTNASSPYSVTGSDQGKLFIVDCTSGNVTVNLPLITSLSLGFGWSIGIKKSDSSTNTIIINPNGTDTIDGNASLTLDRQNYGATLLPDIDPSPDRWTSVMFGDVKTLYSPQIFTPTTDILTMTGQSSTPSNPSAGNFKTYIKNNDKKMYILDSSGAETQLGSNSSGGVNYVSNSSADNDTTGWATYNDAAGTSPVDGTGGTPTATWTRTTSSPLRGQGSFLLTKGATNRQGDGASFDFTIDSSDKAKCLQISFDYIVASGTFVAGNSSDLSSAGNSDVTVWLYDVTNSVLIQPSNYRLYSNSSTISDKFSATFQTSATGSSYRLIFHIGSTSANAYTLKFDNVSVSPSTYVFGSPVTDWQAFTPTGTWSTNTAYTGRYKRDGDTAIISILVSLTGAPNATTLGSITLPSGLTIDTSKLAKSGGVILGRVIGSSAGAGFQGTVDVNTSGLNVRPIFFSGNTGALITQAAPGSFANGDFVQLDFVVPILGWSSSVQMSDGFDGRVIAAKVLRSTNQTINTTATDIVWDSVSKDEVGGYNSSTGVYTIISAGWYEFTSNIRLDTGASAPGQFVFEYAVNGTGNIVGAPTDLIANKAYFFNPVYQDYFKAGDQIKLRITSATNSSTLIAGQNGWYIRKLSSPQTISATDQISASYRSDSSQSLTTGATLKIFGATNKLKDTHGAWNNTLGVFTCPAPGDYRVSFNFFTTDATSTPAEIILRRNTTGVIRAQPKTHGTNQYSWSGSITIPCNANDTLDFFISASAAGTIYNAAVDNWISIERIK